MYHQGNGGDPSIPWPLDSDYQLSSTTKTNSLKHKNILDIRKHHNKTEPSATGGPLEDKGQWASLGFYGNIHGSASQQPKTIGFDQQNQHHPL